MKKTILILALSIVVLLAYYLVEKNSYQGFEVAFLNIGQGDAALIRFENGQKMLVDCGKDKRILSALGHVMPFYDHTIDYVLVTHPDLDHYGGCIDVLKRYQVKHIITNGRKKEYDPYWRAWQVAQNAEKAGLITMQNPTTWNMAGDIVEFLAPDTSITFEGEADDNNNHSIVFRLVHKNKSYLFTGDMERPLELALLDKYCDRQKAGNKVLSIINTSSIAQSPFNNCSRLTADILKVGHHGSPGATSEVFLSIVKPKQAIISVGKNTYGHPSRRVIKHLERVKAEILRTDQLGDIIVR